MNNHFLIIVTGYNCQDYVYNCVNSLIRQTYQNWTAILIDDGSTDSTGKEICGWAGERFVLLPYGDNQGAAYRRYNAIKKWGNNPNDIIVLVGMDDMLKPNALEVINKQYEAGKLMTYGSWENQKGISILTDKSFSLDFDEATHTHRDYRKVSYRSTAPNTFRRSLFDKITEDDFKVNGRWIKATTESPVMFACLEMCGKERIGVIKESIYIYNMRGSQSTKSRMGAQYQNGIYQEIIKRKKFDLI